ncbi:hypothetical protein DOJ73_02235, partial [Salmonella enterica subsp. enterica]|nr:hypothetical protein [Salmonella enterica subsp. enterica]
MVFTNSIKFWSTCLFLLCSIPPAFAQRTITPADEQQISALIYRWNAVLNAEKGAQSDSLYADKVKWYGEEMTSQTVISKIQDF